MRSSFHSTNCILALLVASLFAADSNASIETFRFTTTINATSLGLSANESFIATYVFDTEAVATSPGRYNMISSTLRVGTETVSSIGGRINVFNNEGGFDEYVVRSEFGLGPFLGRDVDRWNFRLADDDELMFSDLSLPATTSFASGVDRISVSISFTDGSPDFEDSPQSFTLEAASVPEPATILTLSGLFSCFGLAGWWRKRSRQVT